MILPFLVSLLAGILASWGVGGGTLLLLVMTLLLGVPQQTAQTINLLFFLPCAAVALLYHRKNGYLRRDVLRIAIPAGGACAVAAALLGQVVQALWLQRIFGAFLLLAGVMLLRQTKRPS